MNQLPKIGIAGTGSYVPERVFTNHDFKGIETSDEWIRERTGIRERRYARADEASSHMSVEAAKRAMESAGVAPEEIDLIVVGTVTPDNAFPSTACHLQHALGCARAAAFDVSAACTGFIYSLSVGWSMARAMGYRNVLVVGVEKLSSIINMEDRTSCILFGDGAGAAVLRPMPEGPSEILFSSLHSMGGHEDVMSLPAGGTRMLPTHETIDQKKHFIHIKGREVFKFAVTKMVEMVELAAAKVGVPVSKISTIIPHQVNLRIIEYAAEKLNYPLERMMINIERYGNTSAASVPIALDEAVKSGRVKRGDLVVMVAFGAGLTWGGIALKY